MARARDRQAHGQRQVRELAVALGRISMFADAGAAARAPRHDVVAAVDQPAPVALRQEGPDRVVVLVGVRVVAVRPSPSTSRGAWSARLIGRRSGRRAALQSSTNRSIAVRLDVALVLEAELLLDLDLDPQPLAVEPVLVALPLAEHGVVALEEVLVRAAPGVVDAHRVVGGDRPVQEAPAPLDWPRCAPGSGPSCRAPASARSSRAPAPGTSSLLSNRLEHAAAPATKNPPRTSGTGGLTDPAVPPALDRWRPFARTLGPLVRHGSAIGPMAPPLAIGWRTREALRTALGRLAPPAREGWLDVPILPASTVRARSWDRSRRERWLRHRRVRLWADGRSGARCRQPRFVVTPRLPEQDASDQHQRRSGRSW